MLQNIKYIKKNSNKNISEEINRDDIYDICKYISNEKMVSYINNIRSNNNIVNVINTTKEIINNGYVFNSIIIKISNYIINNNKINDNQKAKVLFEISFIEKNINEGADEFIQLLKLLNIISNI